MTHKNVENQAEIMRTNCERKEGEVEVELELQLAGGVARLGSARSHEYENPWRENSCHCLTQPTPSLSPTASCLPLWKLCRRSASQATPRYAIASALSLPCSSPPHRATVSSSCCCCLNIYAFDIFVTQRTWQRVVPSMSIKKLYAKSKLHVLQQTMRGVGGGEGG